jgi:2-desacetyl-2-hydroxyethyl bacteriochlorophyllide A dehydrogenase
MQNPSVLFATPKKAVIEDRPMPKPGPDQVVVKARRTLISTGTELTIFKGEFPKDGGWAAWAKFPFPPGYANIGDVTEVGPGVDKSLMGKRVASYAEHGMYGLSNTLKTWPVPDKVSDDEAAFFVIGQIGFNCVRRGRTQWGESAVVYGCGLIGQFIIRGLLLAGARPVVAVDVTESRLDLLPKHDALIKINPTKQNVKDVVKEATHGRMADMVYEATGAQALIPGEFETLRPLGRYIVASSPSGPTSFDFSDLCNAPSYEIIGAHVSSQGDVETPSHQWTRGRNAELYFDLVMAKAIDVKPLISHMEPYTKAPELYQMLLADRSKAMGVVMKWRD